MLDGVQHGTCRLESAARMLRPFPDLPARRLRPGENVAAVARRTADCQPVSGARHMAPRMRGHGCLATSSPGRLEPARAHLHRTGGRGRVKRAAGRNAPYCPGVLVVRAGPDTPARFSLLSARLSPITARGEPSQHHGSPLAERVDHVPAGSPPSLSLHSRRGLELDHRYCVAHGERCDAMWLPYRHRVVTGAALSGRLVACAVTPRGSPGRRTHNPTVSAARRGAGG